MDEDSRVARHKRLVRLIRRIAREAAYEVLDEHVEDYEHKEKLASGEVLESENSGPIVESLICRDEARTNRKLGLIEVCSCRLAASLLSKDLRRKGEK